MQQIKQWQYLHRTILVKSLLTGIVTPPAQYFSAGFINNTRVKLSFSAASRLPFIPELAYQGRKKCMNIYYLHFHMEALMKNLQEYEGQTYKYYLYVEAKPLS